MSYGSGKERKKALGALKEVTQQNIQDVLRLLSDQFVSEYPQRINDRAADQETNSDRQFLEAVARKDFAKAYNAFKDDVSNLALPNLLQALLKQETKVDYDNVSSEVKNFFGSAEAQGLFFEAARVGIRRILQTPLQSGISRTVLQKYLQP